jgi:hypothetical protein
LSKLSKYGRRRAATPKAVTMDQWRDYAYRLGISGSEEPRAREQAFDRTMRAARDAVTISLAGALAARD